MNNSFVLALGLAAIDGLTSAFVAMLILALAVIGSGQPADVDATSESVWLSIRKPSVKFLVIVEPVCGGTRAMRIPQDQPSMQRLRELESQTKQGTVNWIDSCSAEDDRCSAQLFINRPKSGQPWHIYLASADTQGKFTERAKGPQIDVSIMLATTSGQLPEKKEKWTIDDNWHAFKFSVTGAPTLQNADPFKC
jgi:hypothetical protein